MKNMIFPELYKAHVKILFPNYSELHLLLDNNDKRAIDLIQEELRKKYAQYQKIEIELHKMLVLLFKYQKLTDSWERPRGAYPVQ